MASCWAGHLLRRHRVLRPRQRPRPDGRPKNQRWRTSLLPRVRENVPNLTHAQKLSTLEPSVCSMLFDGFLGRKQLSCCWLIMLWFDPWLPKSSAIKLVICQNLFTSLESRKTETDEQVVAWGRLCTSAEEIGGKNLLPPLSVLVLFGKYLPSCSPIC